MHYMQANGHFLIHYIEAKAPTFKEFGVGPLFKVRESVSVMPPPQVHC